MSAHRWTRRAFVRFERTDGLLGVGRTVYVRLGRWFGEFSIGRVT